MPEEIPNTTEAATIMTEMAHTEARKEVGAILEELAGYAKVAVADLRELGAAAISIEDVCNAASQPGGLNQPAIRAFIEERKQVILADMCRQVIATGISRPTAAPKAAKKA